MNPRLLALLVVIGVGGVGILAGRSLYAPAVDGVAGNNMLADAGLAECPLRTVRCLIETPGGGRVTREGKVRVCGTDPVFSRAVRDAAAQGFAIIGCRNIGAATGSETEMADVAHECACSSGANCTAQKLNAAGVPGVAAALPTWTIAGPDYRWVNPTGAGCVAMPCNESQAGREWPDLSCPRQ